MECVLVVNNYTMLVGITRRFYRCMTCGSDLEQYVNGKISYIPRLSKKLYNLRLTNILMAKKAKGLYAQPVFHKTSIGRNPSTKKEQKPAR